MPKRKAAETLTPPDLEQCQAYPNALGHSFMTLGPRPTPIRCTKKPVFVGREPKQSDGQRGEMSLCAECGQLCVDNVPGVELEGIPSYKLKQEQKKFQGGQRAG